MFPNKHYEIPFVRKCVALLLLCYFQRNTKCYPMSAGVEKSTVIPNAFATPSPYAGSHA